jgi:ribosome-associated protein
MGRKNVLGEPATVGLEVMPGLRIPESELQVRRTRSGGAGGQNVNKVSTRIQLSFDVLQSAVLSEVQKRRILTRLATRIDKRGVLRVTSQAERTQARNEARARQRLVELLQTALRQRRRRVATRPPRTAAERRVEAKKQRAEVKRKRRKPSLGES